MVRVDFVNFFGTHTPWSAYCLDAAILAIAMWVLHGFKAHRMDDVRQNTVLVAMALSIISGLLCAVLFDAFFTGDWHTWASAWERRIGFTFTGWLFGFSVTLALFAWFSGEDVSFMLNFFLPSMSLAQAIGRIGCFIGGCCYGRICGFGVTYPPGSLPYSTIGPARVFPVQLLESVCLFVLFGVCVRAPFRFRGAVYMLGIGAVRFALEFLRGDVRGCMFGIGFLSPQQILSIVFLVTGIALWKSAKAKLVSRPR